MLAMTAAPSVRIAMSIDRMGLQDIIYVHLYKVIFILGKR